MPHTNPNDAIGFTSGASSLSIAYAGSKVKSFALKSLYYGCNTALQQGEVETAIACNITVAGYKAGSTKPAATQTFQFKPAQPVDLQNAPTFGTCLSAFQGLEYANFTFTPSTLVVFIMDNLVGSTQSRGEGEFTSCGNRQIVVGRVGLAFIGAHLYQQSKLKFYS